MKKLWISMVLASLGMGLSACGGGSSGSPAAASASSGIASASTASSTDASASTSTAAAGEQPGKGIKVQPIQSTLVEEMFQTLVVAQALKDLGYDIQPVKQTDYTPAFLSVANGDATFMAVDYEPQQKEIYAKAGGDAKMYRTNKIVSEGAYGYLIDKKTADQYHITNLGQLKDPKLAQLFSIDGTGKAALIGCEAAWACSKVTLAQIKAYGLENTVELKSGAYSALIADTMARYQSGKPILYFTWTPYWLSAKLVPGKDVVWLEVPFSAGTDQDTKLPNGKNYGFPMNDQYIVANRKFAEANPAAAKIFDLVQIPGNDISAENLLVANGEKSPEQIQKHAQNWIKEHQAAYDGWIKQARAAKGKS